MRARGGACRHRDQSAAVRDEDRGRHAVQQRLHYGRRVNNLTDSGSSIVTLVGFKLAGKPADKEHPFGHARIEYLSGVIVSFIVVFLGLQLGLSSVQKIVSPEERIAPAALLVLVVSILVKLWQCLFYRKVGRMIRSEPCSRPRTTAAMT